MTEQSEVRSSTLIRYSEILRQQVLDRQTLDPVGRVETLWMYPQVNRVLGVVCKPGLFGQTRLVVKLPQVQSVKPHVLIEGAPEETVVSKVTQLESLIGAAVWSDGGEQVGRITDCLFDLTSGVIIRYLMIPESQMPTMVAGVVAGLTEGVYLLSPKQIRSFSRQRVLIADDTAPELRLYSEGLRLKLAQLSATLTQDYWPGANEEWASFASHLQSVASQAKETLLTLAEKARDRAQALSQTFSQTMVDHLERFTDDEWGQDELGHHSAHESSEVLERHPKESDRFSQRQAEHVDIIQRAATDGDVFDFDDWIPDEKGNTGKDSDAGAGDDSAPWDDWDEEIESTASTDDSSHSSVSQSSNNKLQDSPEHASDTDSMNSEPVSEETLTSSAKMSSSHNSASPSDDESDINVAVDDPWII